MPCWGMQGTGLSLMGRSDPVFRMRVVKVGSGVTVGLGVAGLGYALASWSEPHRAVLALLSVAAAVDGTVIFLLRREIASSRRVDLVFFGWNVAHVIAAGLACSLDGGAQSPFVTVLFVSI